MNEFGVPEAASSLDRANRVTGAGRLLVTMVEQFEVSSCKALGSRFEACPVAGGPGADRWQSLLVTPTADRLLVEALATIESADSRSAPVAGLRPRVPSSPRDTPWKRIGSSAPPPSPPTHRSAVGTPRSAVLSGAAIGDPATPGSTTGAKADAAWPRSSDARHVQAEVGRAVGHDARSSVSVTSRWGATSGDVSDFNDSRAANPSGAPSASSPAAGSASISSQRLGAIPELLQRFGSSTAPTSVARTPLAGPQRAIDPAANNGIRHSGSTTRTTSTPHGDNGDPELISPFRRALSDHRLVDFGLTGVPTGGQNGGQETFAGLDAAAQLFDELLRREAEQHGFDGVWQ